MQFFEPADEFFWPASERVWPSGRRRWDVAIQTRRTLPKASKLDQTARDQSWEVTKSSGTAGRLLVDHSAQTSSTGELTREAHFKEAIEKQREETTINILERWAEPLEQYLSTLQKFERQLREKWLTPEETETTYTSGAKTGDFESPCTHLTSDPQSETQAQWLPTNEVKIQPCEPLSNGDVGASGVASGPRDGVHPLLDNLQQDNVAMHEVRSPELPDAAENNLRARAAANSMASGSLHGKAKRECYASSFRTRKHVEWWPTDRQPRPHTTKPRSEPSIFSVFDPRALLGKQIAGEKASAKPRRDKPEWWPALRRPYSASEIEAMRQIEEDTARAARRKSPSKIFAGYCARRPPNNKCRRRKTQESETFGNQSTSQCVTQQDDDSPERASPMQIQPLRLSPSKCHQKEKTLGLKMKGPQRVRNHGLNLSTGGELQRSFAKNLANYKAGDGGLHALQDHNQFGIRRVSNGVEDQVCEITTQLDEQVCGITKQLQQIKTLSGAHIQADRQSQANLQNAFQAKPMVATVVDVHKEENELEKEWIKRSHSNFCVLQGIERLADKLIDQAVNEVASELAEFCESVADQMYSAEFVT